MMFDVGSSVAGNAMAVPRYSPGHGSLSEPTAVDLGTECLL
jgi:hypothetical protein